MITHEPGIALYAKRDIHFRDGVVVEDRENPAALIALEGTTA
jgi:ABC-type lipoprotein export system ATPase subunit